MDIVGESSSEQGQHLLFDPAHILLKVFPRFRPFYLDDEAEDFKQDTKYYRVHLEGERHASVLPGSPELGGVDWLAFHLPEMTVGESSFNRLMDTLEGLGVYAHLARHPEGGSQLFIFLDRPLRLDDVKSLGASLESVMRELDVGTALALPSQATGVVLPYYRASLKENTHALLDYPSLDPVLLPDLRHHVKRTSFRALRTLLTELIKPQDDVVEPINVSSSDEENLLGADVSLDLWQSELERVAPYWREGKRQKLSLALAGYARWLGVSREQAMDAVRALATKAGDEELDKRLQAVQQTFNKANAGKKVSFKNWYKKIPIQPPSLGRPSEVVLSKVETLAARARTHVWSGRGAASDQAVYYALLAKARHVGREHPAGVSVSLSVRNLAVDAGISQKGVSTVIKRLSQSGLIMRQTSDQPQGDKAGVFILPVLVEDVDLPEASTESKDTNLLHSYRKDKKEECSNLVSLARYGKGRLGKPTTVALEKLVQLGGKATIKEWAGSLVKTPKGLQRSREKLLAIGLVVRRGLHYHLVEDWQNKLHEILEKDGSFGATARDARIYKQRREIFASALRRKGRI